MRNRDVFFNMAQQIIEAAHWVSYGSMSHLVSGRYVSCQPTNKGLIIRLDTGRKVTWRMSLLDAEIVQTHVHQISV